MPALRQRAAQTIECAPSRAQLPTSSLADTISIPFLSALAPCSDVP